MKRFVLSVCAAMYMAGFILPVHAQHDTQGEANRHMHRNPVDRLVRAFESEERASWQKPEEVIGRFDDLRGKTVMDLGAASGYFTVRLARHAGRVIAADVDDRFIEYLQQRLDKDVDHAIRDRIEVRKVPYDDPGLDTEEADAVLLVNTYHHIENRVAYLGKLIDGLAPGGQLMIVEYRLDVDFGPPDDHKISMATVQQEVGRAGFGTVETDTALLPYQYIVLCTK